MTADEDFPGVVIELQPAPTTEEAFLRLASLPHVVFFDSARRDPNLARYSFLAADPFDFIEMPADGSDALAELSRRIADFSTTTLAGRPPFQGGAAGMLSYDLGRSLERVPMPRFDEFQAPAMAIGIYDTVVAFDHELNRAWIISQGFPERDPTARRKRATDRAAMFQRLVNAPFRGTDFAFTACDFAIIPESALAPQYSTSGPSRLSSNFSHSGYLHAVERAIEYVRAGDVFQVNLSQRLLHAATDSSIALYLRLRQRNPATFAGYFDAGDFQIISASPERFVRVNQRNVEARPIKGTRRRATWPEADLFVGDELRESEKDRAENVMIVDLLRNDLSRVCEADSVVVPELCSLEVYEFVQHLVSVVHGRIRSECTPIDLFRAAFPGGSIIGAPKVRAMQLIAELEPTARGPYCGSLAYFGFDGAMDSSILIRTITAGRGWWQLPVGGGIVAQSDPQREFEETWHKAEGMVRALV